MSSQRSHTDEQAVWSICKDDKDASPSVKLFAEQLTAQARDAQARRVRTLRLSQMLDKAFDVTRFVCKC